MRWANLPFVLLLAAAAGYYTSEEIARLAEIRRAMAALDALIMANPSRDVGRAFVDLRAAFAQPSQWAMLAFAATLAVVGFVASVPRARWRRLKDRFVHYWTWRP